MSLECQPHRIFRCLQSGNSSVGRARPCQGRGREFESRFPLQVLKGALTKRLCSGLQIRLVRFDSGTRLHLFLFHLPFCFISLLLLPKRSTLMSANPCLGLPRHDSNKPSRDGLLVVGSDAFNRLGQTGNFSGLLGGAFRKQLIEITARAFLHAIFLFHRFNQGPNGG